MSRAGMSTKAFSTRVREEFHPVCTVHIRIGLCTHHQVDEFPDFFHPGSALDEAVATDSVGLLRSEQIRSGKVETAVKN